MVHLALWSQLRIRVLLNSNVYVCIYSILSHTSCITKSASVIKLVSTEVKINPLLFLFFFCWASVLDWQTGDLILKNHIMFAFKGKERRNVNLKVSCIDLTCWILTKITCVCVFLLLFETFFCISGLGVFVHGLNRLYGSLFWSSSKDVFLVTSVDWLYSQITRIVCVCNWRTRNVFDCGLKWKIKACGFLNSLKSFHIIQINQTLLMFLVTYIMYNCYSEVVLWIDNHMCYFVCNLHWWTCLSDVEMFTLTFVQETLLHNNANALCYLKNI